MLVREVSALQTSLCLLNPVLKANIDSPTQMWLVERSRAGVGPRRENRPARHPREPCIPWVMASHHGRPAGGRSASAQPTDTGPIYLSFVRKAILWDRGLSHYSAYSRQSRLPPLCPRYLSHWPDDLRPPRGRQEPPLEGQSRGTQGLQSIKARTPAASRSSRDQISSRGGRSAVVVPCISVPPTPAEPSTWTTIHPTQTDSSNTPGAGTRSNSLSPPPAAEERREEQLWERESERESFADDDPSSGALAPEPEPEAVPKPDPQHHHLEPEEAERCSTSGGFSSDLGRSSTSLFSRSTSLSNSSVLSGGLSRARRLSSGTGPSPGPAPCSPGSTPQRTPTTTRPGSGEMPTSSPPVGWQEWRSGRWPVLPPISPVRDGHSRGASCCSEISCSQSQMFDELETPRSCSQLSLDHPPGSSDTDLSPGLAALTVGCDSGNLGSISRVHLLLLDRPDPELPTSLSGVSRSPSLDGISERCDLAGKSLGFATPYSENSSGSPSSWIIDRSPSDVASRVSRPPCRSDGGEEPTSGDTLQDSIATQDRDGSSSEEGTPASERFDDPEGRRGESRAPTEGPGGLWHRDKERRMENRKTKVLDMLSKLQDSELPWSTQGNQGPSNFEDFDFLAKYCIFSQEKLAEYKRAFEAVDSDGDGYISCLQVLLALKNILPQHLLSDEEEIYVYRILEVVGFRVADGLTDLRLFAVIASLAHKVATMDVFMRSLIGNMDFCSLEVKLFKAKQLFLCLLEGQAGGAAAQQGLISAEQLLVELKAGGIPHEQEAAVQLELQRMRSLDLLDFLAHLPLFILIHTSIISNPLDEASKT